MELGSEFDIAILGQGDESQSLLRMLEEKDPLWFDSGRSALRFALAQRPRGKILLPEYICESVIASLGGNEIEFYRIHSDMQIDLEDVEQKLASGDVTCFYLMHYFGATQRQEVLDAICDLRLYHGFYIVEDATHALFSDRTGVGDIVYASARKWLPIPDGGMVFGALSREGYDALDIAAPAEKAYAMLLKGAFLRSDLDCNSEYRHLFVASEEKLDLEQCDRKVSSLSRYLLGEIDARDARRRRCENYRCLERLLCDLGIRPAVELGEGDCPLVFPLVVDGRDELRAYLASKRIYCAVHWPFDGMMGEDRPVGVHMAQHELSLPIDQRYGEVEMLYLAKCVRDYYAERGW